MTGKKKGAVSLDANAFVVSLVDGENELVQFDTKRQRVSVLSILNKKHRQERHDGGTGIDHELPPKAVTGNAALM